MGGEVKKKEKEKKLDPPTRPDPSQADVKESIGGSRQGFMYSYCNINHSHSLAALLLELSAVLITVGT